jgi:hypothetical protein
MHQIELWVSICKNRAFIPCHPSYCGLIHIKYEGVFAKVANANLQLHRTARIWVGRPMGWHFYFSRREYRSVLIY